MGLKLRHDTAANWTSVDPILEIAEKGYETDTGKWKTGNGVTHWTSLAYDVGTGTGDASTNTATSVVSEVALFADTSGKLLKRATGSGVAKLTSGVLSSGAVLGDLGTTAADFSMNSHKITSLTNGSSAQDAAAFGQIPVKLNDLATAPNADFSMNSHKLTNVTDPGSAQDAATKAYVDAVQTDSRSSVQAATTTTLLTYTIASGTVTQISGTAIDGVSPAIGDRLLVKDAPATTGTTSANSTQPGNGIYTVTGNTTNLSVSRATDMSGTHDPQGDFVFVEAGTLNAGAVFMVSVPSTTGSFTYGTNNIKWTESTGGGRLTAGTGILKAGNTMSLDSATSLNFFSVPTSALGMGSQRISNLADPVSAQQAATMNWTNTGTATLTNKRITKRVGTTASSGTPTINTDDVDAYHITALAANITSMTTNLSGTPTTDQQLLLRFKDNGTARTITWGASFQSSGSATLLATTVISKTHYVGLVWDGSIWVCLSVDATGY